jgi:hypothetical protein
MTPLTEAFMTIWPALMLAMFVGAIALSYQIEKRSPDLVNRTGVPCMAMFFHTITNMKVARDGKTQSMRRVMLLLLAGVIVLFVVVAFVVSGIEQPMSDAA